MSAKRRGKRGGYRVVYYFVYENTVWLLTIYDKVQKEDLSPEEEKIIQGLIHKMRSS
jgi:mRNA-degrading endonuclease RelE of RelBE toxin-antitoxin system